MEAISKWFPGGMRVKTQKRLKFLLLAAFLLAPSVLCVVLFWKVDRLELKLKRTAEQLEQIQDLLEEQQESLLETGDVTDEEVAEYQQQGDSTSLADTPSKNTADAELPLSIDTASDSVTDNNALHKVYLTFDDGPSKYTMDILDILDQYEVKATFFVLGKEDEKSKEALQEIVARGHSLGLHSYNHKYSEIYRSVEDFADDYQKLSDYLYDVTGVRSKIYRFPGGSSNTVSKIDMMVFAEYLQSQGVQYYDWNVSSGDAATVPLSVEIIVRNATKGIGSRTTSIVLMHDAVGKETTLKALPLIIEKILAMEDTAILPITEDTTPIQHIQISQ